MKQNDAVDERLIVIALLLHLYFLTTKYLGKCMKKSYKKISSSEDLKKQFTCILCSCKLINWRCPYRKTFQEIIDFFDFSQYE